MGTPIPQQQGHMGNLFLGFDPGGRRRFGWSICREVNGRLQDRVDTGLANDAWDAFNQVRAAIAELGPQANSCVQAAGIDAPLLWNNRGNDSGFRQADHRLRELLEANGPRSSVVPSNGLYGAVGIQGPLLTRHLHKTWSLVISECHPRVLEHLVCRIGHRQTVQMVQALVDGLVPANRRDPVNHRRDATLCAVSAWVACQNQPLPNWENLYEGDPGLFNPSQIPVCYWMPIP